MHGKSGRGLVGSDKVKMLPAPEPVSKSEVIECLRLALERAMKYNVLEVNVAMVLKSMDGKKMRLNISSEI